MLVPLLASILSGQALAEGPVDLWVEVPDPATAEVVRSLGLGFVESQDEDWLRFHGPAGVEVALDRAGLSWRRAEATPPAGEEGYHDPDEMQAALVALEVEAPERVRLVDLGESIEGRPLVALRISAAAAPALQWKVLGGHHGDERPSMELALETARHLVGRYGEDAAVTRILDRDAVWILPQLNPDGVAESSRYNARSVDLNRNYAYEWSAAEFASGDAPFSEAETRSIRALSAWTPFAAGLSMHDGETNLGWVWNYTTRPPEDETLVREMAMDYAAICEDPGFWITNGAEWYITFGDTTDYAYGQHGTLDFTLEVSRDKSPAASALPGLIEDHLDAVEAFLDWPDVVAGVVVDADSGLGIPAVVTIAGGQPLVAGPEGGFGRPVEGPGEIEVEIEAPGYESARFTLDVGAPPEHLPLESRDLIELRPRPALVSASGDGTFSLVDFEAERVRLLRPGEQTVEAEWTGTGWQVPPGSLSPGPWTLEVDGAVAPRSLFVGEPTDAVEIEAATVEDDGLVLTGHGFGAGSRAWAMAGLERAPVPLPLLEESSETLRFSLEPLRLDEDPVDLLVLTAGRQVAVLDVLGDATVDTGERPDTGGTADGDEGRGGEDRSMEGRGSPGTFSVYGCSASPSAPPAGTIPVLALALLGLRRRKRCASSPPASH